MLSIEFDRDLDGPMDNTYKLLVHVHVIFQTIFNDPSAVNVTTIFQKAAYPGTEMQTAHI